jgi:hypothetical protein
MGSWTQNMSSPDQQGRLNGQGMSGGQAPQQFPGPLPMDFDFDQSYQDYLENFQDLFGDQYSNNALLLPLD